MKILSDYNFDFDCIECGRWVPAGEEHYQSCRCCDQCSGPLHNDTPDAIGSIYEHDTYRICSIPCLGAYVESIEEPTEALMEASQWAYWISQDHTRSHERTRAALQHVSQAFARSWSVQAKGVKS